MLAFLVLITPFTENLPQTANVPIGTFWRGWSRGSSGGHAEAEDKKSSQRKHRASLEKVFMFSFNSDV